MYTFVVLGSILLPCFEFRVDFEHSIFLDTQDLLEENSVLFKCPTGCRLFSPTFNSNLVITSNKADETEIVSLATISNNRAIFMSGFELKASQSDYYLVNRGTARPRFLLYIVQNTAVNQFTPVHFLSSDFVLTIDDEHRFATVISDTNKFVIRDFTGNFTVDRPVVYTAGFDAADRSSCNPVYAARSDSNAKTTTFYVNGPIATIDFGSEGVHSVSVTNREEPLPAVNFAGSVVYVSPGYVGCPSAQGRHYYSPVTTLSGKFTKCLTDDNIIFDLVADYQINSRMEALNATINSDLVSIYGYGRTARRWITSLIRFKFDWKKSNDLSSSAFAIQIDMRKENSIGISSWLLAYIILLLHVLKE